MVRGLAVFGDELVDDERVELRRSIRGAAIATALAALGYGLMGALGSAVVGLTTEAVSDATMPGILRMTAARITGLACS